MIPIIPEAAAIISNSFRKYLENVPGEHDIKGTTKNSHIVHRTHTVESTDVKVENVYHGK
jgi:hypothetical protein